MAQGPLAGIRVVDLTSVVLGPYATQTLGDMGADVIKVEAPEGDVLRGIAPLRSPGMGAVFMNANRNKRSVALDLKQKAARAALLRLVAGADVFVHSMRPRAIARLGLAWEDLKAVNPRLVYCSAWGFGQGGPYEDKPAYDDVIQAMSGVADLAARQRADGEPRYAPTILADKTAGLTVTWAIAMALFHRERTGEGQEVEVPMFETLTSFVLLEHMAGAVFDPPGGPMGYDRVLAPHRRPYATADGHITVMPYTTKQWQRFFVAAGRPEMADDVRVTDAGARSRAIAELYGMIADAMPARPTAEWLATFEEADIPAMPVNRLEDLPEDPHLKATGFFQRLDHPTEGPLVTTAIPVRFKASPGAIRRGAPRLGAHTREVLAEAGLSSGEIDALLATGAGRQAEDAA
ncbi:CaiB/BaiF CoA transferase family protein [Futiania mangrovi]|uniref:CaiB/BaiF CoA transferase family protein n=1 Tax=Futiania mangrovi TaxID=2959716 RepID=UPI0022AF3491|nr:CoA transferase [Futiania mangrovii]